MKENLEKRQSEVIAAMRFPLMVLLLFAHVLPMTSIPIEMNFSEMNVYHLFSEGISHNLSRIRNPLFFFFSGFFFFLQTREGVLFLSSSIKKESNKPFASLFIMEYTYDIGCLYKELCVYFSFFNGTGGGTTGSQE